MKLPLDYTPRTLEARSPIQGKPGFPDYVVQNISLRTSFVQWRTPIVRVRFRVRVDALRPF